MKTRPLLSLFFILAIAFLSLGTVVKKKDPVLETQTGPIGYLEKAKEEAEGKKGPPVPTLELFPKERFLAEGAMEKGKSSLANLEEKEGTEAELWLEEEGNEQDETEREEGLWNEGEEEFKLKSQRDDTREKSTQSKPGLLDRNRG